MIMVYIAILLLQENCFCKPNDVSASLKLQYFEDPSGKLSVSDICNSETVSPGKWINHPVDRTLNFGISNSVFWIRCQFNIQDYDTNQYYLHIKSSVIDYLDIYTGTKNSYEEYMLGDRRAFSERPVNYRQFVVPVKRDYRHNQSHVYIRVASYDGVHESVPISIISGDELRRLQTFDIFKNGLFWGILFFMIILSIALFFIVKDRSQILFIAYVISFGFWSFVFKGFADMFFWSDTPVSNTFLMLSVLGFGTFMGWFSIDFLSLNKVYPTLNSIIKNLLIFMAAISVPLILLDHYRLFFTEFMIQILAIIVLLPVSTVICLKRKVVGSRFYACSWLMNFVGSFLYIGKVFGFLPPTFLTENAFQIGIIFQASVMLIGIIVRIYAMIKKPIRISKRSLKRELLNCDWQMKNFRNCR